MRGRWFTLPAALCLAACSTASPTAPETESSQPTPTVESAGLTPSNIRRMAGEFPPGYELADIAGPGSPVAYWGFGADWTADPPECASLAAPAGVAASPEGLSGSGPGGIIYTAVTVSASPLVPPNPVELETCRGWSARSGGTTASVEVIDGPAIDDSTTVRMTSAMRTVVEGGTETVSTAHTATAYLENLFVFVVVVTDPGLPSAPLPPELASDLLVKAVALLRG